MMVEILVGIACLFVLVVIVSALIQAGRCEKAYEDEVEEYEWD